MVDQTESSRRASSVARGSNRGRLVEVLRRQGPLPRVELARSTGLSFPAVSGLTSRLIAEELLCETETGGNLVVRRCRRRGCGRAEWPPPWPAGRAADPEPGVRAHRRGLAAHEPDRDADRGFQGSGLAQSRLALPTRALDAGALRDLVIAQINAMLDATATPRHRLLGIGIALQGIVNADTGRHLWSPALSITEVDLATPIRQAFGVEVVMANDAVAVALALTAAEPALAQGLSATIMVGHGIGMGVVVDGEARWGAGAGSEIGHVKLAPDGPQCRCGQRGCIEAYLADYALYRDARTFLDLPPADFAAAVRGADGPAARAGTGRRSPP